MNLKLIFAVVLTEYRRFFGEPAFYVVSFLRPYLWTLLLSEGIRHSVTNNKELSFLGLLSYCIVFTGITSAFSLCWERHYGFLKLWFVYGINNFNYITGKLLFSSTLTIIIIIVSLPLCLIINISFDPVVFLQVLPDVCLAITLIASIGLFVASVVTRLDLFGIVINFILFPILFTSGAIYEIPHSKLMTLIAFFNPLRWAIEPIKCAIQGDCVSNGMFIISRSIIILVIFMCLFFANRFLKTDS